MEGIPHGGCNWEGCRECFPHQPIDEGRRKRGIGKQFYDFHGVTCLCVACEENYRYHTEVLNHRNNSNCEFCIDHNYALNRVLTADQDGRPTMSSINICDRCESLAIGSAMGILSFATDPTKRTETKSICPMCVAEFVAFMAETPTAPRPKVFKEPYAETPKANIEDLAALELAKKIIENRIENDSRTITQAIEGEIS